MSTILNKFSRRGKKSSCETQLDSKWGDFKITSPTERSRIWQVVKSPEVDIHIDQDSTSELNEKVTLLENSTSISAKTIAVTLPHTQQKHHGNNRSYQSESDSMFPPTPRQTPLQSPALISTSRTADTSRDTLLSEIPASIQINTQLPSYHPGKVAGHSTNAFGIHGIISPATTVVSPAFNDDDFESSHVYTSVTSDQKMQPKAEIPAHGRSSSADLRMFAHQPRRVDKITQDRLPIKLQETYTSMDAAAVKPVIWAESAGITPISDEFSESLQESQVSDIAIYDETVDAFQRQSFNTEEIPDNWPLSRQEIPERQCAASPFIAPRPQRVPDSQTLALFDLLTPGLPKIPSTPMLSGERQSQAYQDGNLMPTATAEKSQQIQSRLTDTSHFNRAKSPFLGSCGRMRVQPSSSRNSENKTAHTRDASVDSFSSICTTSSVARSVDRVQRQRSCSVEPPLSPPVFDQSRSTAHNYSDASETSLHQRLRSDNSIDFSRDDSIDSDTTPVTPFPPQLNQNEYTSTSKRSRSQATFISPDLRKRQAFSNSPQLPGQTTQHKPSSGGLYDDIRNDFRVVSREARIAKNVEMLSKFNNAQAAKYDKLKAKWNPKSTSRARGGSNVSQRLGEPGEDTTYQPAQLVPSYEETWG